MLPHRLACRASALLVCHDPEMKSQISDLRLEIKDWQAALVLPQAN